MYQDMARQSRIPIQEDSSTVKEYEYVFMFIGIFCFVTIISEWLH